MRVKTIYAGLAKGLEEALKHLDDQTNDLHAKVIHDIRDHYLKETEKDGYPFTFRDSPGPRIVRRILYTPEKSGRD